MNKWINEWCLGHLWTCELNWARRTSWGWRDKWSGTALLRQNPKFEPWRSEANYEWAGKKHSVLLKLALARDPRISKQAASTTTPGPPPYLHSKKKALFQCIWRRPVIIAALVHYYVFVRWYRNCIMTSTQHENNISTIFHLWWIIPEPVILYLCRPSQLLHCTPLSD